MRSEVKSQLSYNPISENKTSKLDKKMMKTSQKFLKQNIQKRIKQKRLNRNRQNKRNILKSGND